MTSLIQEGVCNVAPPHQKKKRKVNKEEGRHLRILALVVEESRVGAGFEQEPRAIEAVVQSR